jgi:hypothetical protein
MADVVLGHPYSGALYAYFSDQIGGDEWSHTRVAQSHSYYRTLYGNGYQSYIELALTFLLLYDHVWIVGADNHMPTSRVASDNRLFIPELGLHTHWDNGPLIPHTERERHITRYLADGKLQHLLSTILKVPASSWQFIVDSAAYEAALSSHKRLPLLCSRGRRAVIERLIAIDAPAMHPVFAGQNKATFVQTYSEITGLALRPKSLDDLMVAKPDPTVRAYGSRFLDAALTVGVVDKTRVAELILEAMDNESTLRLFSGRLKWVSRLFGFGHPHHIPISAIANAGSFAASHFADASRWYEFSGSIDHAVERADFIKRVTAAAQPASRKRQEF